MTGPSLRSQQDAKDLEKWVVNVRQFAANEALMVEADQTPELLEDHRAHLEQLLGRGQEIAARIRQNGLPPGAPYTLEGVLVLITELRISLDVWHRPMVHVH